MLVLNKLVHHLVVGRSLNARSGVALARRAPYQAVRSVASLAVQTADASTFDMISATCRPLPRLPASHVAARLLSSVQQATSYILSEPYCHGSFGEVSYALDGHGTLYAAKEVQPGEPPSAALQQSAPGAIKPTPMAVIQRELTIAKAVNARVQPVAVLAAESRVVMVMPMFAGDLNDAMKKALQLGLTPEAWQATARSAVAQLAGDLLLCHGKGYVYRDVKLGNALFDKAGVVALCDFGLAGKVDAATHQLPGRRGTPFTMAPEVWEHGTCNSKADVWSLGITFCDMHAPRELSPFQVHPRAMPQRHMLFAMLRAMLLDKDDHLDATQLSQGTSPAHRYLQKLVTADALMGRFVLERMLDPDPETRASMQEVQQFVRQHQPVDSSAERLAAQALSRLASPNAARKTAVDALRRYTF